MKTMICGDQGYSKNSPVFRIERIILKIKLSGGVHQRSEAEKSRGSGNGVLKIWRKRDLQK